jgi:hypothetical protein
MADENDALRRKIKKLETEIAQTKVGTDPRRQALWSAGVPLDRLDDAARVFRPSGNASTNIFRLDEMTGDLDTLARRWLEGRPWFGTPEPEVKPEPDDARPRIENGRAIFADGSELPVDILSTDDLFVMAGETPKVVTPEPRPDDAYINEGESDLDRDFRLAGPTPKKAAS